MNQWRHTYPNTASWLTYQLLLTLIVTFCSTQPAATIRYATFGWLRPDHDSTWLYFLVLVPMIVGFFVLDLLAPAANKPQQWPEEDRLERESIELRLARFKTWQIFLALVAILGTYFYLAHRLGFQSAWFHSLLFVPFYFVLLSKPRKGLIPRGELHSQG